MRSARVLTSVACLVMAFPLACEAASFGAQRQKDLGNGRFGATLRRGVFGEHRGSTGVLSCNADLNARLVGRNFRVLGLRRRVEGASLGGSVGQRTRFQLELIGRGNVSIGLSLSRSASVTVFTVPVPVGPFTVTIEGSAAVTVSVGGSIGRSSGNLTVGLEGSAAVGGSIGVGVGVPGAQVGVEGALNLIRAALPATCTMRRSGVTVEVSFLVESTVTISLFAKVGFGPFSKKWTVDVPFLRFTFARRTFPIASRTVRA